MDASRRILARQQQHEAWSVTLHHDEWAQGLRRLLEQEPFPRDDLILHFECGPSLGVLYSQRLRELRRLGSDVEDWKERLREHLTPSHAYLQKWQEHELKQQSFARQTMAIEIDGLLWRSPQPRPPGLALLQEQGLTWVCNLRDESRESERFCRELGLGYYHIPVTDMSVPTLAQVIDFLHQVASLPPGGKGLVHCFAGQGRTGLFVACYRIFRGAAVEDAISITDREIRSRGMRPQQREWVTNFSSQLPRA